VFTVIVCNPKNREGKMKITIFLVAVIILMSACQTKNSDKQINNQDKAKMETIAKQEIKNLLLTYRDALNASDVR